MLAKFILPFYSSLTFYFAEFLAICSIFSYSYQLQVEICMLRHKGHIFLSDGDHPILATITALHKMSGYISHLMSSGLHTRIWEDHAWPDVAGLSAIMFAHLKK